MTRQALATRSPMPVFLMAGDLVMAGLTFGNTSGTKTGTNAGKIARTATANDGQGSAPVTVTTTNAASDAA